MADRPPLTRRRLIGLGGGVAATVIAGCSGTDGPSETPTDAEPEFLRGIAFEGTDLVVQLEEDHEISRLNLIAPDGSLFGQTDVPLGATTARIEILDIKPEVAGFKHYTPGDHELVAVSEAGSTSTTINLEPDLRIVDVRQFREGSRVSDYGKLVVEVENVGTGPTWVYSIKYRDAPNFSANDELGGDPGVLKLESPDQPTAAVIPPNAAKNFIGSAVPIMFVNQKEQVCTGTYEFVVFAETAIGAPLEQRVSAEVGGQVHSTGLVGQYTCSSVAVELE